MAARHFTALSNESLVEIRATDARFRIRHAPGTRDLIIAGPGFARHVRLGKKLERGSTTDLGDIHVEHGFTIGGRVLGPGGLPVAGAEVSLVENFEGPSDDSLLALAWGNFKTTSDKMGAYTIRGFQTMERTTRPATMRAWGSGLGAMSMPIPTAGNHTIDIAVEPAGIIEGTITGTEQLVQLRARATVTMYVQIKGGAFRIDGLPAGKYAIGPHRQPKIVTVTPNQVTTIVLP